LSPHQKGGERKKMVAIMAPPPNGQRGGGGEKETAFSSLCGKPRPIKRGRGGRKKEKRRHHFPFHPVPALGKERLEEERGKVARFSRFYEDLGERRIGGKRKRD